MSDDEKNYEECLEEVQTNKLELSNDQIENIKINLNSLKEEANKHYSDQNYIEAINKYTNCISMAESINYNDQLSKLYMNKGLCFNKLVIKLLIKNDEIKALENFSKAIGYDALYIKAYTNRMNLYYKRGDYIEALEGKL